MEKYEALWRSRYINLTYPIIKPLLKMPVIGYSIANFQKLKAHIVVRQCNFVDGIRNTLRTQQLDNLDFPDDLCLLAHSQQQMQNKLYWLKKQKEKTLSIDSVADQDVDIWNSFDRMLLEDQCGIQEKRTHDL